MGEFQTQWSQLHYLIDHINRFPLRRVIFEETDASSQGGKSREWKLEPRDAEVTDLGRARMHYTRHTKHIIACRNCLTDRNLHFGCPSGSNDDYGRRIASLRWSVN